MKEIVQMWMMRENKMYKYKWMRESNISIDG